MENSPPLLEFEDRKTGLTVFGFFTILMGIICALFVPLMLFGQTMAAKSGAPQNNQAIIPAMAMYGVLAVALVWLGIGSMMARRWARALLLIFSWTWLIVGALSVCVMGFMLPRMTEAVQSAKPVGQPQVSAEATAGVFLFTMIVMGVIFVILPGIWVLFYKSRHVKATCEAHDPTVCWTDRCPLPVLAVSLWLAFCVPMMLAMPFMYHGVFPFFGAFVAGPAGSAAYVVFAVLWAFCARAFYKVDMRGWWVLIVFVLLFSISSFITYSRHDIFELYALMGYPEQQIEQLRKFSFFTGSYVAWASVIGTVPMLGYLIYLRKFFPARA